MLASLKSIEHMLASPVDPAAPVNLTWRGDALTEAKVIDGEGRSILMPLISRQPVFIDFDESALSRQWFEEKRDSYSLVTERRNLPRTIKTRLFGTHDVSGRNFDRFESESFQAGFKERAFVGVKRMGTDASIEGGSQEEQ